MRHASAARDSPSAVRSLRPYLARMSPYRRFWAAYCAVLFADQVTKLIVLHGTEPNTHREVVPGFFWISHVYNKGAAWSLLAGNQGWLVIFAVIALAGMYRWRKEIGLGDPAVQFALGAFAGGAIGNVIDRLAYEHVVDFLRFRIPLIGYDYPVFNIADTGITLGAAFYVWRGFFPKKSDGSPATRDASARTPGV